MRQKFDTPRATVRPVGRLLLAAFLALALLVGCESDEPPAPPPPAPRPITEAGLERHLAALDSIAERNGGERAAGTPGYEASVDYVAGVLRDAGWRVRVQDVPMALWRERSPATLLVGDSGPLEPVRDFRVPSYSAAGRVEGTLRVVDDACDPEDFDSLAPGEVAFTGLGECFLAIKTANARRAGATALVVQTSASRRGVPSATLARPGLGLPVVLMSRRVPARDGDRVRLAVDATTERGQTQNVVAEIGPARGPVVMAGAHLDSVPGGPGINDNGSGVAALLEVARTLGPRPPGRVRLAFWGGEEEGLVGSRRYVRELSDADREAIRAYLNFDMVGSPNAVPAVYSDGDPEVAELLRRVHPGREGGVGVGGLSDHAPFDSADVPVNGLYTGRDRCYHLPCDTLDNVDLAVLLPIARAAARALAAQAK
jgi:Iap family predicted aminopeptidase